MEAFDSFLTARGKEIYNSIRTFNKARGIEDLIEDMQIALLANSMDLYARMAEDVNKNGSTQKPAAGGWDQVRPQYTVMRAEFQNIMKQLPRFGLTAKDREVLIRESRPKKKFDLSPRYELNGTNNNGPTMIPN